MTGSDAVAPIPTLRVEGPFDRTSLEALSRERLGPVLVRFLEKQRWYGDKDRTITTTNVEEAAVCPLGPDWVILVVLGVGFADEGEDARYLLPLAVGAPPTGDGARIATIEAADRQVVVADAFADPSFPTWLLDRWDGPATIEGSTGRFVFTSFPGLRERLPPARKGPIGIGGVEQSNSSVRFDDALFVKLFRRSRAGVNPDLEIGRFLAERTGFRRFPEPLGTAVWVDAGGTEYPLALVQAFVSNLGDGWTFLLDRLGDRASTTRANHGQGPKPSEASPSSVAASARRLGERTGQLHLALASDTTDTAFIQESTTRADAHRWAEGLRAGLRATAADLRLRSPGLSPDLRRRVALLAERLPEIERRAEGFSHLVGLPKIRVHGDYHLGQTLRTSDDDWILLDFEGEPRRTIAERRAKTSPLKDVAGMLRSFAYARGATLRGRGGEADTERHDRALEIWEAESRAAFLAGYRAETDRRPGLLPADEAAFGAALAAWEIDKAVYEVAYELNNRPDWLELPLGALLGGA